jgi:hypothetical protein
MTDNYLHSEITAKILIVELRNLLIITSLFGKDLFPLAVVAPQSQNPGYAPSARLGQRKNLSPQNGNLLSAGS